ncbi:MAG: LysE family transporter [Pseudomonadota bacterium]|nr:LysE family transporter [Pseudomonadota bacterium]
MEINYYSLILFCIAMVSGPGPANMLLMSAGVKYGAKNTIGFLFGVILSKQLIIWPIAVGINEMSRNFPEVIFILKVLGIAYILWLTWKILISRISLNDFQGDAPGFKVGLLVHPLNPKAWMMVTASVANYTQPDKTSFLEIASIALIFFLTQCLFHPVWWYAGNLISKYLSGKKSEKFFLSILAVLTVSSIILVFIEV